MDPLGGKRNQDDRKKFGAALLRWAASHDVMLANCLTEDIQSGFPQGDDAFDAVVGLFGMLQVCLGQRATGEPDDRAIREIEWVDSRPLGSCSFCPRLGGLSGSSLHNDAYNSIARPQKAELPK
jgi:hypothetical protein